MNTYLMSIEGYFGGRYTFKVRGKDEVSARENSFLCSPLIYDNTYNLLDRSSLKVIKKIGGD